MGEHISWDPAGTAVVRTLTLNDLIIASGPPAPVPGNYRVRAVYQVDVNAETKFAFGITPARLVSNQVEVEVKGVSAQVN